jgi:nucleotide-binding universal stress UspA family protein
MTVLSPRKRIKIKMIEPHKNRKNKMKKILIALDYDPTAQKVAEAGYSLAKAIGAEIILIHVIADPVYYSSVSYSPIMGFGGYIDRDLLQSDILDSLKKGTQDYLNKIKIHLNDESIQIIVKDGDFAESILQTAKELYADIIVIGSHSRRWLETVVMGSVTEKVLHHTSVPLFIVPTKKHS